MASVSNSAGGYRSLAWESANDVTAEAPYTQIIVNLCQTTKIYQDKQKGLLERTKAECEYILEGGA